MSPDPLWHTIPADQAIQRLDAGAEGLEEGEAAARLTRFGANTPPQSRRDALIGVVLRQFASPLIYILLFAALISALLGHWSDFGFILAVIGADATLGPILEWNAETSAEALRSRVRVVATVIRSGRRLEIDAADLVPGDIVILQSGAAVPADVRLIATTDLVVDESLLTGEAAPVRKDAHADVAPAAALGDRRTMAYAGTMVVFGRATAVVCGTGAQTQIGGIAGLLAGRGGEAPLLLRMRKFTNRLAVVTLALVFILAAAQVARGDPLFDILLFTIALAVSAIPEGLPIAITASLGVASSRMGKRGVIVRRLPAVEALGSCTLIATDKTGTLTVNRLTVKRIMLPDGAVLDVGGEGLELEGAIACSDPTRDAPRSDNVRTFAEAGVLTNEAHLRDDNGVVEARGDAVDVAFLVLAEKASIDRAGLAEQCVRQAAIDYEPKRGFSASINICDDQAVISVKGAPEKILPMCEDVPDADVMVRRLASQGFRVLAVAQGAVPLEQDLGEDALSGLRLLGLAGLIDPLRDEAPRAVAEARAAGLDVRMITGDHPETALAIARQLEPGEPQRVVTGARLDDLGGEALASAIREATVFARVEPAQKNVIVRELQKQGHFVAVTGDGVNDAPALKAAHVGVAMGAGGTDVARAASDLIITDDNFASIVAGIEEGRAAYANIRKVIWLLLSTGIGEIMLFSLAIATGSPLPLAAVQILWLNLVHEGLQDIAISLEAKEPDLMRRPPRRPAEPLFDRLMIEQCLIIGVGIGALAFALFWWLINVANYEAPAARNLVLLFMVSYSNLHALNCRSETRSVFRISFRANPVLMLGVIAAQGLHLGAMHVPVLQDVLGLRPVSVVEWVGVLGLAAVVIVVAEAYKFMRARPLERRTLLIERKTAPQNAP